MIGGKPEDIIFTSGGTEVCDVGRYVELITDQLLIPIS
jgi:hypothetical protein